ncbi:hypothetical protein [Chryseobacterium wangxinyae]|uniref:hypothetical protein n=2 Tax=unclassified Chryseobacterium TaxID=2593645 RepID=UPI00226E9F34|nr:hypothetical protein [Chryseobacterium sp. CY353]MCY0969254.1 hypothetical protein [Chryseobacterium sp. CY353]
MNKNMQSRSNYIVVILGLLMGIIFYFFNLMISNSEVSSIDPNTQELFRNIDYLILVTYAIIGAIVFLALLFLKRLIFKR